MGVDYTNAAPGGRQSVRLTSKASYQHALIIVDLAHMPGSICGTWPALYVPFFLAFPLPLPKTITTKTSKLDRRT